MNPQPQTDDPAKVVVLTGMKTEKSSLREIFEAEESPLLHFAMGILGRREVAEDLVQESFLKLHHHWEEVANPRGWIYRTVRNLALNYLRDHRREVSDEGVEGTWLGEEAPEKLARFEAAGALRMLIAELPRGDRDLLNLRYEEGLRYEEISARTGISVGNVGYRLHHLLKGLAAQLRKLGVEGSKG